MLRCKQIGLTVLDLEELTEGFVVGMLAERSNDDYYAKHPPARKATQEDIDNF